MGFLFERPTAIPVCLSLLEDPHSDTASISEYIWDALQLPNPPSDDLYVSVSRLTSASSASSEPYLTSLTCSVRLDMDATGFAIPKRWLEEHPTVFYHSDLYQARPEETHSLIVIQPTPLEEVIFEAMSEEAYAVSLTHKGSLEGWFLRQQTVLRQGAIYSVEINDDDAGPSSAGSSHFRLVMAAPTLQGYAKKDYTRFYVTNTSHLHDQPPLDALPETNGHTSSSGIELQDSDRDSIEIAEDFLANSTLPSMLNASPSVELHNWDTNGHAEGSNRRGTQLPLAEWTCSPRALQQPVSLLSDDSTIYVRTADLRRIGVLNGDWAIASSSKGSSYRLVQICTKDEVIPQTGSVFISPQLMHNILGGHSGSIRLRSSPFGSRKPAVPIAKSLTIARIASPFSMDRAYQPSFLRALERHFKSTIRLIKQGDVIALKIDSDDIRHQGDEGKRDSTETDDETSIEPLPYDTAESEDTLVYFVITNIEHNIIPSQGDASSVDTYVGSTVGELGCWVDPVVTRILQTGVEHSRVPDVAPYLGVAGALSISPSNHSPGYHAGDSPYDKLVDLSSAALNRNALDYNLQLSILLDGPRGVGKATVASQVARHLGVHLLEVDCYDVISDSDVKTEGTLRARFDKAAACSPCILLLRHVDAFAQTTQALEPGKEPVIADALRECINSLEQSWKLTGFPILVYATTNLTEKVPSRILSCFKHEVKFEVPSESDRHEILKSLLHKSPISPDVSLRDLAVQTAALVAADLVDLVSRASHASRERACHDLDSGSLQQYSAGLPLSAADFDIALASCRAAYSESIGAPKIPSVSWDDVGGLAHVKADILDTIQLPLEHPELFADGLKKRSGILLYGPPGTGKTLLAKAVATSCALNFFSVKGPELLNMYIGESEANVRRVFQKARDARPCVIFFDELDSVAPKRGNHGDSGGVMDRIVSQILAELDGLSGGDAGADVFVIGATNRPDLLDSALLRPGRFDRMLYLGVSNTHEAQLNILQALTRKFHLHPDLRLEQIAGECPFHYTGADFYALCADALLKAMSRKAEEIDISLAKLNAERSDPRHPYPLTPQYYLSEIATPADIEVLVTDADFRLALRELIPSVSEAEMEHYARIQQRFSKEEIKSS